MKFDGAVVKEQGVMFAIVVVKNHVVNDRIQAEKTVHAFQASTFPGIPVVLMGQSHGRAKFFGRPDIVRFLSRVPFHSIPWKRFNT